MSLVLDPAVSALFSTPRVGTLGVVRADGSPHLTPVRSVLHVDEDGARVLVLTRPDTVKARVVRRTGRASVAEHTPHAAWATLEGTAWVPDDPEVLARARASYDARYGEPDGWGTCVLVVAVERVLTGS
ncbi:pyridoxamine 5'-phosphate oxidase family protein [Nocardioides sp. CFH 31398]|uniref:pyridoxamine 5'-phosphate oxidase family protein n=1 Tax=Nocardioides sp. CFH 31398 TaxID=2919579 RepID=UPI001F06D962|nr:pyridoxamine 5'-phosphate oxidase family protein [Nocardioides sp. CFH 31398]MCH1867174.1 pyridoxamine 5'-phosphate oxidase family protein [Nocardioides sp. CFH 31398]